MPFVPSFPELLRSPKLYGALGVLTLGGLVIWLAIWLYGDYEPYCTDYITADTRTGERTMWECVESQSFQRGSYMSDTTFLLLVPGLLIVTGGLWWIKFVLRDWRWNERIRLATRSLPDPYEAVAQEVASLEPYRHDNGRKEENRANLAEIAKIGRALHEEGGMDLMLAVYHRVTHLRRAQRSGPIRHYEVWGWDDLVWAWNNIGDWRYNAPEFRSVLP